MPPPPEGSPTPSSSTPRPAPTPRPSSSRPQSQPQSRPTQTRSQTSQTPSPTTPPASSSTSASQSLSTPPLPPAPPAETPSPSPSAQSTLSQSPFNGAAPTPVNASSTNSPVSTPAIAGAAAGGAVVVLALLGWFCYRRRQRKRSAVPPPRPFSTWINDRNARGQTMYDATEVDPYAMSSLYRLPPAAAQSGSSSIKASPISETAPATYLSLPVHGRSPTDLSASTDSWVGTGTPSTATSALPLISPASTDAADTPGPFAAALHHQSSRRSVSSTRDSPAPSPLSGSPAPTPPPTDVTPVSPFAGGSSRSPSIHSSSRSSVRRVSTAPPRPVSYAPSIAQSRHSIYAASASTIRGAPHQPHNRIDIVLPAPLAPETFVPVAPFMASHSRTGSDRSRMSMGAMSTFSYGQAWREDSPSREGSIADDVMSVRSQRSTATISASAQAPLYDPRYPQSSTALPPVPPLPASVTRSSSPASPAKTSGYSTPRPGTSNTITSLTDALGLSGTATPTSAGPRTPVLPSPSAASMSTAEYGTPLGSPELPELRAPYAAAPGRMSLEELAAAAVDTLLSGQQQHNQQRT